MKRELRSSLIAMCNGAFYAVRSSNRFLGTALLFLMLMMSGESFGQAFTENMGTATGTIAIATNSFQNTGFTFSGTADTRSSGTLSTGYTGASGGRHAFFTASGRTFEIAGISTTGYTGLQISFGLLTPTANIVPTVEVSSNGTVYSALTVTATTAANTWTLKAATGTIPATANLRIRFTSNTAAQIRIDDISLTGTSGYTVTFDANGGTGTMANQTASAATALTSNTFTRTGYTFSGWNTVANGSGTAYANGASYPFSASATLYAQWTPIYTVTYYGNTNTGGAVPSDTNSPYTSGSNVTILGNTGSLTKTGYSFNGWNTAVDGSGTNYAAGATLSSIAANTSLYARWTPNNNTITFDKNAADATGTMASQTLATAATANLTANGFSRAGHSFQGWATTAGGTVAYTDGASYTMGTSNVTLYAKWVNLAPTATAVNISGTTTVGQILTGNYTYNDTDPQGTSTFKWYRADDASGTGEVEIGGATAITYTLTGSDFGKYIRFTVIPVATAGTLTGIETTSSWVGPIAAGATPIGTLTGAPAESSLNTDTVQIDLTNTSFVDSVLSTANFTLNNAPTGMTINGITYDSSTSARITFTYDNTDFDADITTFSITIASSELTSGSSLTTNAITITAVTETLSVGAMSAGFGNVCITQTSSQQTFTISGINLKSGNISLAALSGFAYSEVSGGPYTSTLSFTHAGGNLVSKTIYVVFAPTLAQSYNGDIVVSNTGAPSVNRSVTGTGTYTAPVVTSSAATAVSAQAATLQGNVTNTGCPAIVEKGFVYSLTATDATPTVGEGGVTKTIVAGTSTGSYTLALSALPASTGYSFNSYIYNGSDYFYGTVRQFTTSDALVLTGTLAHGSICPTVAAGSQTYTITNNSNATVTGIAVGSSNAEFAVSGLSSTSIVAGGTATYSVTFTPATAGAKNATITVSSTDAATVTNTVTGTGITIVNPSSSTLAATAITNNGATLQAGAPTFGVCPATTAKGFVISETLVNNNPLIGGSGVTNESVTLGTAVAYNKAVSGLTPGVNYTYKSYLYDGTTYTYGATQNFTVLLPASQLFLNGVPTTGTVNTNLTSFTVEARRPDNSIDTYYTGTITIAKASGPGALSGTLSTAAVAGVATFNTAKFDAAGTYTISTSSGSLTTATSGNIVVTLTPVTLANYLFTGTSCSSYTPSNVATNLNFSNIAPTGITCNSNAANSFSGNLATGNWGTAINTATRYLEFTVTPNSGYDLTATSLTFDAWRSSAGATGYEVRSSIDSYGSTLGSGTVGTTSATKTVTLGSSFENLTAVTFRIYGYGGSSTGDFRLDNISLIGNVILSCAAPADPAGSIGGTTTACTSTILTYTGTDSANAYWQTSPTGTSTTEPVSSTTKTVSVSGTHYIRIYSGTCWSINSISQAVTINTLPATAGTPSPTNGAADICYSGTGAISAVSWTAVAGATSYDVYFGAGSMPGSVTANVTSASYTIGTLSPTTTYHWKVVAKNSCGDTVGVITDWSFSTVAGICYCTPTQTNSNTADTVTNVSITNSLSANYTNTTSGNSGYVYVNNTPGLDLVQGSTTNTVAITFGSDGNQWSVAWIDFNQNGSFETGEAVGVAASSSGTNSTVTYTFTVPATATLGTTRLRVRGGADSVYASSSACSNTAYGDSEDYNVNIIAACTPAASATALTVNNPTTNTIDLNFTRGNGDGVLIVAKSGSASTAPTSGTSYGLGDAVGGGTVVYKGTASGINASTIQTISSLLENTQYYFSIYEYVATTNCYQVIPISGNSTTLYKAINVKGNTVTIANNDTTPSVTDHTEFESAALTGGTIQRTFTIENTGTTGLNITSVSSSNNSEFAISSITTPTTIGASSSTTFIVTFDPSALGIRTSTITIANNDITKPSFSFTIQGTGINSNTSDIITETGFAYTSNINYTSFQSATIPTIGDGVGAFRFTIRDGGATATDTDVLGTELTGITINATNIANIRTARLFDGSTLINVAPTINTGAGTIVFTGLSGTNVTAADNATKTLTLYVSFLTTVTDNAQLQYTVASATTNSAGSSFAAMNAGGAFSSITGDINRIEVTADRLAFGTQPTSSSINADLNPFTIHFLDVNNNLDFDTNRSVTLTATNGGVNMISSASYPITAPHTGIVTFSNVQFTSAPQTAITITATTTGLSFNNTAISTTFNIDEDAAVTGDYRTIIDGDWSTLGIWQIKNASNNWVAASVVPAGGTSGGTAFSNTIYINNTVLYTVPSGAFHYKFITIKGTGKLTKAGSGVLEIAASGKLLIKSNGTYTSNTITRFASAGTFEIEDEGNFYLNYGSGNQLITNIFAGIEKFHPNSNFFINTAPEIVGTTSPNIRALISDFNYLSPFDTGDFESGYFGNIIFDTGASNTVHLVLGEGTTTTPAISTNYAIAAGDIIYKTGSNTSRLFEVSNAQTSTTESTSSRPYKIGGSLKVLSGYTGYVQLRNKSVATYFKIGKNLEIENGASFMMQNFTNDKLINMYVGGDVKVNGTGSFQFVSGGTNTGTISLFLSGDIEVASTAFFTNSTSSSNANLFFVGTGDGSTPSQTQTVSIAPTVTRVNFNLKHATYGGTPYVQLANHLTLGTNSTVDVRSTATLDFGFNGSTANNAMIGGSATGTSFTAQTGSILKITSPLGITTSGTTGNVQTTSRTYPTADPYADYYFIGKVNQNTGNGLPANVRNLTINNEGSTNDITLSQAVTVQNTLTMTQGNIVSSTTNLLELGSGTSNKGTLTYASGYVKGPLKRWFSGTNSGNSGLFPFGTTANLNRFARIEYSTGPATPGSITLFHNPSTPMGKNGLAALAPIAATGSCTAFEVLSTDDSFWEHESTGTTSVGGVFAATLQKESTSTDAVCKHTLLKKDVTDWLAPGTHIEPSGTPGNIIVQRTGLTGITSFGIGNGFCSKIPTIYSSTSLTPVPTRFDSIEIQSDIEIGTGAAIVACECKVDNNASMTIKSGGTLTLLAGLTVENDGDFVIEDSGSLVQVDDVDNATANNNTGNIIMRRNAKPMFRYDFTYWSSPVTEDSNFSLHDLSSITLFDKYFKWNHSATPQAWAAIPHGTEDMVPGRGYIVRAPQNYAVETPTATPGNFIGNFIGKPNNGTVKHAVTGGTDKWNLIGNPYPSAISADLFFNANVGPTSGNNILEGTLYLWTHNTGIVPTSTGSQLYVYNSGDYASYNGTGGTATVPGDGTVNMDPPSGNIAAGQSFFIKGTADGEVIFNNSMRIAGNNGQFFRPAPTEPLNNWDMTGKHRVWLNMKGEMKGFSQILVGYIENASNDWDTRFDGENFGGNQVTLYSVLDTKKLVIQGRALPFNNQDEVPLGYKSTLNGTLTINLDHYDGLFEGQDVYLEDKLLNIVHDLKESAYSFTSTIGTFNERFVLRYLPAEELSNPGHEAIANGLIVYQENNTIMLKSQLEDLSAVTVYDLLGRVVFDQHTIGKREFGIQNVVMNEQPLIIKVKLANGQVVNKKIVY